MFDKNSVLKLIAGTTFPSLSFIYISPLSVKYIANLLSVVLGKLVFFTLLKRIVSFELGCKFLI